jgi:hypothetical protein
MLDADDKELIKQRLAANPDYTPRELQLVVRERTGTPCTVDEISSLIDKKSVQQEIETRRSVIEKNADYSKQELVNEMLSAKDEINDILSDMRSNNRSKSTVEAAGELRKTLELLGKTIDAIQQTEQGGDQYIRIDELTVEKLAAVLNADDVSELAEQNGLTVQKKE